MQRLGRCVVVEDLATALGLVHDPAAAAEEAGGFRSRRRGKQRQMACVVPPVVVVEPADELAARPRERRRTRVDLAAALVRQRLDARIREPVRGFDPVTVAVVDHDGVPVLPVLGKHAAERTLEQTGPPPGGNDHGEVHVDPG